MPDSNTAHDHPDDEPDTLMSRLREIDATVRDFARQRPILTALAALSTGYLVGRVMRKL